MKKILVLIEEESKTSKTINWAIQHAGNELSSIVLAYVMPPDFDIEWDGVDINKRNTEWEVIKEKERMALLDWKYFLRSQGYQAEVIELNGTRIHNLVEVIDKENFDLLVMSAQGRSWLEDKIMGSPWSELMEHAKMPIFIIPNVDKKVEQIIS